MKIICTICSRHKKEGRGLLPAKERYTGEHIAQIKEIARMVKLPLYFLSGKYGLILGNQKIPYYDYYLEENAVGKLAKKVNEQIQKEKINEIDFYMEDKVSWSAYLRVIKEASEQSEVKLNFKKF